MMRRIYFLHLALCLGAAQLSYCVASIRIDRELWSSVTFKQHGAMALGIRNKVPDTVKIPFHTSVYYGELYTFNCSIGTPPQNIAIAITMGLGDIIINNSTLGIWVNGKIEQKTFYDPKQSKTFHGPSNTVYYANATSDTGSDPDPMDMSSKSIIYSQDTLSIGGNTFQNMDFISGTASNISGKYSDDKYFFYWLGLGPQTNVASAWSKKDGSGPQHDTFLQALVKQKQIRSKSFSIWLDDPAKTESGHLLLGGINSQHYQGSLTSLNTTFFLAQAVSEVLFRNHTTVSLDYLSVTNNDNGGSNNTSIPIVAPAPLHSFAMGYYLRDQNSYFPPVYASVIWDAVGADYNVRLQGKTPIVPCSFLQNSSTLDITLAAKSDLKISIPMSDITMRNGAGPRSDEGKGNDTCVLAILPTPLGLPNYLSKAMLKNVYLLFDLENNIVSAALTNFSATHNNVIPVPVGGLSAIPNATFDGNTDSYNSTNSTSTANVTSTTDTNSQPVSNSGDIVKKSLAIGGSFAALALVGLVFFLVRRRNKAMQELKEERAHRHNAQAEARAQAAREFPNYTYNVEEELEDHEHEHDIGLADLDNHGRSYTPLAGYAQGSSSGMMGQWRDDQALLHDHPVEPRGFA